MPMLDAFSAFRRHMTYICFSSDAASASAIMLRRYDAFALIADYATLTLLLPYAMPLLLPLRCLY